jgi:uncharacterized protein
MRWLRIGGLVAVFLPLAIAATAAHKEIQSDFRPTRSVPARADALGDTHFEAISFETPGATLHGWFIPSSNSAAVLLVHGTDADRTQLAREAVLLARHGYGALLFDWPGHGESEGAVTWDANERAALAAALDYVSRAPGIDPERIGLLAFSMGGMIAIQVAARDRRVAALVVEGAFADAADQIRHQFRHWGVLSQWPALWTARWLGLKPGEQRPKDVIANIAPRPVFVIAGTADEIVLPTQTRALFDGAREPKDWWLVSGATHGRYADADRPAYEDKIVRFYDDALIHKGKTASLSRGGMSSALNWRWERRRASDP